MRLKLNAVFFALILALALAIVGSAQESPRPARQTQKAATDPQEKTDIERVPITSDEMMRRAMLNLSTQMDSLTKEMRLLRKATERNSMMIELLLYEERLAKIEDKLDAAIMLKTDLDAREAELQRRMKNIQQEVMMRGGLRRDEAEAALRAELQRALDDTKTRLSLQQERISELQAQAARLRTHVEALRKKLDRDEQKSEQPQ
jgi:ATP-dependent Lon protease